MKFFDQALQAKVVRHEEKEENLARFIGYYLDRLSITEAPDEAQRSVTLLARSPLSPSARAVLGLAQEISAHDVQMFVIFCKLEPAEQIADWIDLAVTPCDGLARLDLRWARSTSLLDAHEQMVLGTQLSWSGDCMRREPEKRDAYELFATFNSEATQRAMRSFHALWNLSQPVAFGQTKRAKASEAAEEGDPLAALAEGVPDEPRPVVSTRH